MSDLIKRTDAIKALRCEYPTMPLFKGLREEWAIKTEGFRKAEEVIMSVPSADRPQEWIPCSERLPRGSDGILECEMVLMTLSVGYVACGWINGDTAYVLINNPTYDQIVIADSKEVIAWMPLPKPWKGTDDE